MKLYPFSEFDGEEDAADDREAWFLARRVFVDGVAREVLVPGMGGEG